MCIKVARSLGRGRGALLRGYLFTRDRGVLQIGCHMVPILRGL